MRVCFSRRTRRFGGVASVALPVHDVVLESEPIISIQGSWILTLQRASIDFKWLLTNKSGGCDRVMRSILR